MQQQSRVLQRLILKIPASAGNLGPGLDTLGLALSMYATLYFTLYDRPQLDSAVVSLHGAIKEQSTESDQAQLTYKMLRRLWSEGTDLLQRVRVEVMSDIPLGAGLGSTTATILGSLWASKVLKDVIPTKESLVTEGVALEGYPETLAASLLGSFVVCSPSTDGHSFVTMRLDWPQKWQVVLVVPGYRLKTSQARAVLSKKVSLEQAVTNIQRTAMLVAAVNTCDELALKESLHDELHEEMRVSLVPELAEVRTLLKHEPILGCVLCGAGPAIAVIVNDFYKAAVMQKLNEWAQQKEGKKPSIMDVSVDRDGMQILQHEIKS